MNEIGNVQIEIDEKDLTLDMATGLVNEFVDAFTDPKKHLGKGAEMNAEGVYTLATCMKKVLECHAEEVAELSRTIRNLSTDNEEMAEAEAGR